MRLSKASAYAVFAALYIAEHNQKGPVQRRMIAECYGIPPEYLQKILQRLVRSRILESETGRRGGFSMRKPPGRTTLLDIVEAIDGPLNGELTVKDVNASDTSKERIEAACGEIARATRSILRQTTIKHLIRS